MRSWMRRPAIRSSMSPLPWASSPLRQVSGTFSWCGIFGPRSNSLGPSSCLYSAECVEEAFSEVGLPLYRVLGSWSAAASRPPTFAKTRIVCGSNEPHVDFFLLDGVAHGRACTGGNEMSAKKATQKSTKTTTAIGKKSKAFTDEERAAMKERTQELKAEARRTPRAAK